MANICENTFHACSDDEKNLEVIKNFLEDTFDADVEVSDVCIDAYFDSRWTFPEEQMEELFEAIPNKEDIYMRCLSIEYGCMYHALFECGENGWHES